MAQLVATEVAQSLNRWLRDGAGDLPEAAARAVVERVAEADPNSAPEARTAANYLGRYVAYRLGHGLAIDDSMFAKGAVDAYRAAGFEGVPTNSKAPHISYIKRLAPGVGLRGTTRKKKESEPPAEPAPTPTVVPTDDGELAAVVPLLALEVARAIDGFVPEVLDRARYGRVRELACEAVRRARPDDPERAVDLVRTASYMAAWLDDARRPLRIDVLLGAANIEQFVDALAGKVPDGSVATYAGHLHFLRLANGIDLDVERREFGSRARYGVYSEDEEHALYERVSWLPTAKRRRQVENLLDLVFGAGATPKDASRVEPTDVSKTSRGVVVRLSGRAVLMRDPYGMDLLGRAEAAAACGDRYLIGGTGSRIGRISAVLQARRSGHHGIDFDMLRARDTWLIASLQDARWESPAEFLASAGRGALERLQRLGWAGLLGASNVAAASADAEAEVS